MQSAEVMSESCKQIALHLKQATSNSEVQLMGDILQDDGLILSSPDAFVVAQPACLIVCFLEQSFIVSGIVESCSKIGGLFLLNFKMHQQDKLQTRMLLQLSEIEQYRHSLLEQGRELSLDQAAAEWVGKYAESFASEFDSEH